MAERDPALLSFCNPPKEQRMKTVIRILAAALALTAGAVQAQSSPTETGAGHEAGGRWGKNYTPGWAMMNAKERKDYQTKIEAIHTQSECKAFVESTAQQMAERPKSKGMAAPAAAKRDACAKLK
jgi:Spy/CpxP family protein refolding chaperone